MVSVMTAPLSGARNWRPIAVSTGMTALGRAWRKTTTGRDSPFARAVMRYSSWSTSRRLDRTRRARVAADKRASDTAGSTSPCHPGPLVAGSQGGGDAEGKIRRGGSHEKGTEEPQEASDHATLVGEVV